MRPVLSLALLFLLSIGLVACDGGPRSGEGTHEEDGSSLNGSPLIGLVFVQAAGVGAASYHFDEVDDIYISYEALGLPMGNGLPIPTRKAFIATSFDLDQRTFFGTIDWSDPEGTTVFGTQVWVYEMIFDESYTRIAGGSVTAYSETGAPTHVQSFISDLSYERL